MKKIATVNDIILKYKLKKVTILDHDNDDWFSVYCLDADVETLRRLKDNILNFKVKRYYKDNFNRDCISITCLKEEALII